MFIATRKNHPHRVCPNIDDSLGRRTDLGNIHHDIRAEDASLARREDQDLTGEAFAEHRGGADSYW